MKKKNRKLSPDKFKCFVRYIILVAKQKRCVTYSELENVFGLGHGQVGYYCGMLGDYCLERGIPPLNGLVISSKDCRPSEGYEWYQQKYGKSWGEVVSECWKLMHVSSSRKSQVQDFSDRDDDVERFLAGQRGFSGHVK